MDLFWIARLLSIRSLPIVWYIDKDDSRVRRYPHYIPYKFHIARSEFFETHSSEKIIDSNLECDDIRSRIYKEWEFPFYDIKSRIACHARIQEKLQSDTPLIESLNKLIWPSLMSRDSLTYSIRISECYVSIYFLMYDESSEKNKSRNYENQYRKEILFHTFYYKKKSEK